MFTTHNPATGQDIESFPPLDARGIDAALTRAEQAFGHWRTRRLSERAHSLHKLSAILMQRSDSLAHTMTAEMGKTLHESLAEIDKCARHAAYYAEHGPKMLADEPMPTQPIESMIAWRPLGPILAVMPWNFPLWQVLRFAVPTWLAGNTVVLKHAPNVLRCGELLAQCVHEAGFGAEVLQHCIMQTEHVGAVIEDRRIAGVTLTGSPKAGAAVAARAGRALKKTVLELGGNDAFIVLADADIEAAVRAGIRARFGNAGQVCLAAKRFILEAPIAQRFTEQFTEAARALVVGDPLIESTQMGPMAREDLRHALHKQVQRSCQRGAQLLLGGQMPVGPGYFYPPTVLDAVEPGMPAFDEETFGPVAALMQVRDADAAVALANQSVYGLSASVWTQDRLRAKRMAQDIHAGAVFINSPSASDSRVPVGGVGQSGYGRELAHLGPKEFMNAQTVWVGSRDA